MLTGLIAALAGCELIVRPDVGLIPTFDAACTVCLDAGETVIDIDGDIEIVDDGGDGGGLGDVDASNAAADANGDQ